LISLTKKPTAFLLLKIKKNWMKMLARRGEQLGDHVQAVEVLPHPALRALDEEALRVRQILSSCIRRPSPCDIQY
jgi:hypothetical protein